MKRRGSNNEQTLGFLKPIDSRQAVTQLPLRRRTLLLAGAGLPLLASCASELTHWRGLSPEGLARELKICSAAYAVLHAGRPAQAVAVSGCGGSDARADAVFQAASLTKPVVAFAALQLVRDGRLDLDAPLSRYLPQGYRHAHSVLKRSVDDAHDLVPVALLQQLRVAQLLNHSTGLANWSSTALSLESAPGTRWAYSGEGYVLLQSVIEAVTGTELSVWLDRQVFGPLGMADSSLVWREAFADRAARGTAAFGLKRELRWRSAVAAASLYTTAADYARFMAALLGDDALLSLTLSQPVEVDARLGLQWGLGWGIEQGPDGPCLWQWGNNPGFRAFAMASLRSRDGFVVLSASERGMPLAASIAETALPGDHPAFRCSWVA